MFRWDHTSCRRLLGFGVLFSRLESTFFCLLAEIHDGTDNESPAAQACSGLRIPEPLPNFLRFFFRSMIIFASCVLLIALKCTRDEI